MSRCHPILLTAMAFALLISGACASDDAEEGDISPQSASTTSDRPTATEPDEPVDFDAAFAFATAEAPELDCAAMTGEYNTGDLEVSAADRDRMSALAGPTVKVASCSRSDENGSSDAVSFIAKSDGTVVAVGADSGSDCALVDRVAEHFDLPLFAADSCGVDVPAEPGTDSDDDSDFSPKGEPPAASKSFSSANPVVADLYSYFQVLDGWMLEWTLEGDGQCNFDVYPQVDDNSESEPVAQIVTEGRSGSIDVESGGAFYVRSDCGAEAEGWQIKVVDPDFDD